MPKRSFGGVYHVRAGMFRITDFIAIMAQESFKRAVKALGERPNAYGMFNEDQARRIIAFHHATNDPRRRGRDLTK